VRYCAGCQLRWLGTAPVKLGSGELADASAFCICIENQIWLVRVPQSRGDLIETVLLHEKKDGEAKFLCSATSSTWNLWRPRTELHDNLGQISHA